MRPERSPKELAHDLTEKDELDTSIEEKGERISLELHVQRVCGRQKVDDHKFLLSGGQSRSRGLADISPVATGES